MEIGSDETTRGRNRPFVRDALKVLGAGLLALNLLALAGHFVRDRSVVLALLLYLPLPLLGLGAILLDLVRRGRGVARPRFALASVGLVAAACSCLVMIGHGPGATPMAREASGGEVRLLHWNVLWGGGKRSSKARRAAIAAEIFGRSPDVVVLSEGPPDAWLASLTRRLGAGWSATQVEHAPGSTYWYKLVVLSRWPVRRGPPIPIRNGAAMSALIERPGRPIRLLVVDGQSRVTRLRTPMLHDVAGACRRADLAGIPFDTVLGDFNAVGRSLGFDALRSAAGGYAPASRSSAGWRGTWPAPCPLYDIDHVWVHSAVRVLACTLFTNFASDHRGQLVRLSFDARDRGAFPRWAGHGTAQGRWFLPGLGAERSGGRASEPDEGPSPRLRISASTPGPSM